MLKKKNEQANLEIKRNVHRNPSSHRITRHKDKETRQPKNRVSVSVQKRPRFTLNGNPDAASSSKVFILAGCADTVRKAIRFPM